MREPVAADLAGAAPAVDDLAFGVDDGDLAAAGGQGDLVGVAMQADATERGAGVIRGRARFPDPVHEFVAVQHGVGELEFHGLAGRKDAAAFDGPRQALGRHPARAGHVGEQALPEAVHEDFGLFLGLGAHRAAEVRFHGRLIFSDLGHLDAETGEAERVPEIHVVGGQTLEFDLTADVGVDFVRDARQVVLALRGVLDPRDHRLAALLEGGERAPDLGLLRQPGGEFAAEEDAGDLLVLGGEVDRLEGAQEVEPRARRAEEQLVETRRAMLRSVFDREPAADHEHRLRLHVHMGGGLSVAGRTGHPDQQHDEEEGGDEQGEDRAEGGGEDRLEEFFHGDGRGVAEMMLPCLVFANPKEIF